MPRIRYIGTGPEFKAWFEDRGVTLQQGPTAVRVSFVANAKPQVAAEEPLGEELITCMATIRPAGEPICLFSPQSATQDYGRVSN